MKSSTLHRAGLSQERMNMLERARAMNMSPDDIPQYMQSSQVEKAPELDVLYRNFQKSIKRPSANVKKTPGVYLGVGFALGAISMLIISLIVGISSMTMHPKQQAMAKMKPTSVAIIPADKKLTAPTQNTMSEERYTIKSGDTLDKVAYRFYGKYDNEKIQRIQTLNNIKSPTALQIGQVIIIPVDR